MLNYLLISTTMQYCRRAKAERSAHIRDHLQSHEYFHTHTHTQDKDLNE